MTERAPGKARTKKSPKATRLEQTPETVALVGELSEEELAALARTMPSSDGPIAEDGTIRPVQIGKRGRAPVEMTTVFILDDVEYAIPAKPNPALVLRWMMDSRMPKGVKVNSKRGKAIAYQATENVLVTLLGQEALNALSASPDVEAEDMADIFGIVSHIFFGAHQALRLAADPS